MNDVYLHINNGGIEFAISDKNGPTIKITATHFGNITNNLEIYTNKESLEALGNMFLEASKKDFSESYCCPAAIITDTPVNCSNNK